MSSKGMSLQTWLKRRLTNLIHVCAHTRARNEFNTGAFATSSSDARTDIILFIKNRHDATLRGQPSGSFKLWTACCQWETGTAFAFDLAIHVLIAFKISISLHSGGGELKLSSSHNERIGGRFFASSLDIHLHFV